MIFGSAAFHARKETSKNEENMKKTTLTLVTILGIPLMLGAASAWAEEPAESKTTCSASNDGRVENDSLAYAKDDRADIPKLTQPDHFVKTWEPVVVRPQSLDKFPEELELRVLPSPDPLPAGLAWDGTHLWIAGRNACKIFQIDPQDGKVLANFPAPGELPTGLACDGKTLWHTDEKLRTLYALEGGKVTKKFVFGFPCSGVAVTPQGVIVSDSSSAVLRTVSPENGSVLDTAPAPDTAITALAYDGTSLWCGRGGHIIVHDLAHKRPIGSFAVSQRVRDRQQVAGLTLANDRLWYADAANGQIVNLAKPRHGQHLAARSCEHDAVFTMSVRNASDRTWPRGAFLMNVPIYEMPGQRFLHYQITPEPMAHYRDSEGNLHALVGWDEVAPGDSFQVTVRATLWSADRWTFIDPKEAPATLSEPLQSICADSQGRAYPLAADFVLDFLKKSVGEEQNPFWQFRLAHDAFVAQTTYVEPADGSVAGVLKTGKGVCRHFSNVLVTLGRTLKVPVLDAWAPHHNICCVWIHGAGWVFVEPTINITNKRETLLSSCLWFNGLPRDELTTGVGGPALEGDLLVDGVPFIPQRHCRIPKDLPGFRAELDWMMKNKSDKNNYNPFFFAMLQARRAGEELHVNWLRAVDVEGDGIEYAIEANSADGPWQEVGRTKEPRYDFTSKEKIVSVRVSAIDGHHDMASAPKAECRVP
jgi:hypothetical protein